MTESVEPTGGGLALLAHWPFGCLSDAVDDVRAVLLNCRLTQLLRGHHLCQQQGRSGEHADERGLPFRSDSAAH